MEKDFTVNLVKDVGGSTLVIGLTWEQKTVYHQIKVINRNAPPGIIVMEEKKENNQIKLYYDLKNSLPLSYYIEREEISGEEVIRFLDEIVGVVLESKNYLLFASSFLLQQEYIYFNPDSRKVLLVYLPVKLQGDVNEKL